MAKKTASSWAVVGGGEEVAGEEVVGGAEDAGDGEVAGEEVVGGAEDAGDGEVAGLEVVGAGGEVSAEVAGPAAVCAEVSVGVAGLAVVGAGVSAGIEVSGEAEPKTCLSLSETSRTKASATGGSSLAGT